MSIIYVYNVHISFFENFHLVSYPYPCFLGIKRIQFSTRRVHILFMSFCQVMAIIADFMLVCFFAPAVSLRPALAIAKFFYGCLDNTFQIIV